jgi:streptomycin 6-kinase
MIAIPESFARITTGREGEPGARWLARLPGIVDGLLERWGCVPDGEVMHGGIGVIVPVRRRGGQTAVLKVSFPHPGNIHEPDAFTAWAGRGAVRLYERDDQQFAMLLERAQACTLAAVEDGDEAAAIAGRICRRLAIPAPPVLRRLSSQASRWERQLDADAAGLAPALPGHAVDAAVATVHDLGYAQPDLMVHGDLHAANILRADREPWLVVDPKGYAGDPGYDAAMVIKSHPLLHLAAGDLRKALHRRLAIFADAAEFDRERARRWAQFHAVRSAFWGRRHGFRPARGGPHLDELTEFADRVAELLAS